MSISHDLPPFGAPVFETVLVANRGEIAVRIMRTLRSMGIRSVAVYSDADANALHVRSADQAVRIGPAPARESYLSVDRIVAAAVETGAQAIHPGYGFLSENPALAAACDEHGIVFVGPPVAAIEAMGDKIAAKATVAAAGVRVVPGSSGAGLDDDALAVAARDVGFPVLLKPSAGGGGKGMRLVDDETGLGEAIASARREARNAFGDDTLLVERFVRNPRHIEIQVLADTHGNVVHLGERECSLQRRHQKIVEEAPSPLLTPEVRAAMGQQAVDAARSCGYVGAGTVEFIVSSDRPDEFFFMEMNTRLQVEHPVTEQVYGVDLVEWQLRIAAGQPIGFEQHDLHPTGHAVEVRVYAEDPARGFLPTGGVVTGLSQVDDFPGIYGVRVDTGVAVGAVVGSDYDPMLAKVIAHGRDRADALGRLDAFLGAAAAVHGVTTNIGFLRRLLALDDVRAGRLDTGLVERHLDELARPEPPALAAAYLAIGELAHRASAGAWGRLVGWRHGEPAWTHRRFRAAGHDTVEIALRPGDRAGTWVMRVDGHPDRLIGDVVPAPVQYGSFRVDGVDTVVSVVRHGRAASVAIGGWTWELEPDVSRGASDGPGGADDGVVRSPMPGTVIAVPVAVGDEVVAGQPVAIVEAMKMEHSLVSPVDGVVAEVHAPVGGPVALDAPVITVTPN
jgi:acetyl-CoA/propionyl-CoA carboxylase biotin carboxyl carrier protein